MLPITFLKSYSSFFGFGLPPRKPDSPSFFTGKRSPYLDFVHFLEEKLQKLKELQEMEMGVVEKETSDSDVPTWVLQQDLESMLNCTMKARALLIPKRMASAWPI